MYRNRALIHHLRLAITVPVQAQVKMHSDKETKINLVAVDKAKADLEDF